MKNLLMVAMLLASISCVAQNIPEAVKNAFTKNFPNTQVKKWDREDGNYEANFSKDNKAMSAVYNAKGAWMETETDINVKQLPSTVIAYIQQHYRNAAIKEAASLKTPQGDRYEAEVKGVKKDLLFDGNGKFLKEEED